MLYSLLVASLMSLRLLAFDVDATPPVGSELTYQTMERSSDHSLRARGIVLYGAGEPIVICSVDWIGISNESQDAFKDSLAAAVCTIPERVQVHTVHQHDAPICDFTAERILLSKGMDPMQFDGSHTRKIISDIKSQLERSAGSAVPVTHISTGTAKVKKVASNRIVKLKDGSYSTRYSSEPKRKLYRDLPEGVVDPEVSVLTFWNENDPVAVLSFYATHPQSYYLTKTANPDFPGIARSIRQLEEPDALHVHFNGAGGNIAAGKYNDGSHKMRLVLAQRLAAGMRKAYDKSVRQEIRDIRWITEPMTLPADEKTEALGDVLPTLGRNQLSNFAGQYGWYTLQKAGRTVNASCLAINDNVRIIFMPGELFVEYQLAAKNMRPGDFVAMAAYGDYGPFYIGTRDAYEKNVYEIRSSPETPDVEEYIMEVFHKLFNSADNPQ